MKKTICFVFAVSLAACSKGDGPASPVAPQLAAQKVFYGRILSMNAHNTAFEAVAVDARGVIVATGTRTEVTAATSASKPEVVQLADGQVMLPGFIEPHIHVVGSINVASGAFFSLTPCRAAPFGTDASTPCYKYLRDGIAALKQRDQGVIGRWHLGLNADPSRQPFDATTTAKEFKDNPGVLLDRELGKGQPSVLVDQSGHLAYVNQAAFDALEATYRARGAAWPPTFTQGGQFVLGANPSAPGNAKYSGQIREIEGFRPFLTLAGATQGTAALATLATATYIRNRGPGVVSFLSSLRARGVTTVVNIADDASSVTATDALVALPEAGIRISSLVFPEVAEKNFASKPVLPSCDPRSDPTCRLPASLGVTGIKMTSDGSTQGCSAGLVPPVQYAESTECPDAAGHLDFDADYMFNALSPLWRTGQWRFETHANGNGAMRLVAGVYGRLQREVGNNPHPAVLIHATVGDEATWQQVADLRSGVNGTPALDVRVTHLIGHVAYWGTSFERLLGVASAANIDPLGWDQRYGIPFTLHSDSTVTPTVPLWFVQQAVTRESWDYPELATSHVVGPEHRVSVLEALRAVTSRAAEEKELQGLLGSIEVGKVADFVVLAEDPLAREPASGGDPSGIGSIGVIATYLGGVRTQ